MTFERHRLFTELDLYAAILHGANLMYAAIIEDEHEPKALIIEWVKERPDIEQSVER